jgi:hypothetical protein
VQRNFYCFLNTKIRAAGKLGLISPNFLYEHAT